MKRIFGQSFSTNLKKEYAQRYLVVPPPDAVKAAEDGEITGVADGSKADLGMPEEIVQWAAYQGIDSDLGLLILATTLAHTAGPSVRFGKYASFNGAPPPSLFAAASDAAIGRAVQASSGWLVGIQQNLVLNSRKFSYDDLDGMMDFLQRVNDGANYVLDSSMIGSEGDAPDVEKTFSCDVAHQNRSLRYESLVRPRFAIIGAPPSDIEECLGTFHLGYAFHAGGIEHLPDEARKRGARVNELLRFLDGDDVVLKNSLRSIVKQVPAVLRGIFRFTGPGLAWLLEHRRDYLDRLFPICSSAQVPEVPLEPHYVEELERRMHRLIQRAVAERRAGAATWGGFTTVAGLSRYMMMRRDYAWEITPDHVPAAAVLPDLLLWYLLIFVERRAQKPVDEEALCDLAFAAARRLRARALGVYRAHEQRAEATERYELARRLIRRLSTKQRCGRRELARGLNKQRMSVIGPVIDDLIRIGVFAENDGVLEMGIFPSERLQAEHFIESPQ